MLSFVRVIIILSVEFSFWSKDIVFLVTDGGHVGTFAWLEAYHGFESTNPDFKYNMLHNHGGSVVSVLNLEFEGSQGYSAVGIHPGIILLRFSRCEWSIVKR